MFIKFLIVGSIGFFIDVGITLLLIKLEYSALLARSPAILIAMAVTWLLNRSFTFRVQKNKSFAEALQYVFIALSISLLNYSLYSLFIYLDIIPFVAIIFATGIQVFLSFYSYQRLVFNS